MPRVALVSGGTRGIGAAISKALKAAGYKVAANYAGNDEAAQKFKAETGIPVYKWDVSSFEACAAGVKQVVADLGPVDVLVNNAGIEIDQPFAQITAEIFDRVVAVNLRAPLLVTQALVPLFPACGGAIVNISSIHANHAFPNAIPYACSKAGLVALTRNLALELAPRRIRVNAVCPGYIDTPMWDEFLSAASDPEALAAHTAALHPLGRRGAPADVAHAVAYLAGPQAEWITGTCLVVDGGLTVRAHP